jgi:hypothetical protein
MNAEVKKCRITLEAPQMGVRVWLRRVFKRPQQISVESLYADETAANRFLRSLHEEMPRWKIVKQEELDMTSISADRIERVQRLGTAERARLDR